MSLTDLPPVPRPEVRPLGQRRAGYLTGKPVRRIVGRCRTRATAVTLSMTRFAAKPAGDSAPGTPTARAARAGGRGAGGRVAGGAGGGRGLGPGDRQVSERLLERDVVAAGGELEQ